MNGLLQLTSCFLFAVDPASPSITLGVDSAEILAGDPLLCKITLRNEGEFPVKLYNPHRLAYGNIALLAKRDGGDWTKLNTFLSTASASEGERILEPRDSIAAVEPVFLTKNPLLTTPGEFELKAIVTLPNSIPGQEVQSEPIRIRVQPRDPKALSFVQANRNDLLILTAREFYQHLSPAEIEKLQCVRDGNFGIHAECWLLANDFVKEDGKNLSPDGIRELLKKEPVAGSEIRKLQLLQILAHWCARQRYWDALAAVLTFAHERTFDLDLLEGEMKHALKVRAQRGKPTVPSP